VGDTAKSGRRKPSLKKRLAARASVRRAIRHRLGVKAPKGAGWVTDPKKAAHDRICNRTTKGIGCGGCSVLVAVVVLVTITLVMSLT
jgi:hypothetical protein